MPCNFPKVAYQGPDGRLVYSHSKAAPGAVALKVRCGGCMACRIDKAAEWKLRLMHERKLHEEACFLTLTVDPEHYPSCGYLGRRLAQLFMKRLRKFFAGKRIRFFLVMEYGDRTWRSHFHLIVFGANFTDRVYSHTNDSGEPVYSSPQLAKLWGLGRVSVDDFNEARAGYVAGYAVKKIGGEPAAEHYTRPHPHTGEIVHLEPEYMLCSKRPGIGFEFFDEYEADAFPSNFFILDGRKHAVPEAYKRRWKKRDPELADGAIVAAREAFRPTAEQQQLAAQKTARECVLAEISERGRERASREEAKIAAGEAPSLETRHEALGLRLRHRQREAGGAL